MLEEKEIQHPLEFVLTMVTIISAVAFLAKIFGKGEEEKNEETAKKSRGKTYTNLTYQEFQYRDWAENLKLALMQDMTEDEDVVYNIFSKQKNIGDINKLIEYFGEQRRLYTMSWLTLPQAISLYFSNSEKKKLNGIISHNGINYTFE